MDLVPNSFRHKAILHRNHPFGTGAAATLLVTAPGTGLSLVPIAFAWMASGAGSFTLTKGSGGASYFAGGFLANGQWQQVPWWDDGVIEGVGANTSLEIVKAAGVGLGNFHVWYMIRRIGAGEGGTTQ